MSIFTKRALVALSVLLTLPLSLLHASDQAEALLKKNNIPLELINLSVTTYKQKIAYKMQANIKRSKGTSHSEHTFFLLYDPFTSYGIDLRLEVKKEDIKKLGRRNMREIRQYLDEIMGLQSRFHASALFDRKSLTVEYSDPEKTIISFFLRDSHPFSV